MHKYWDLSPFGYYVVAYMITTAAVFVDAFVWRNRCYLNTLSQKHKWHVEFSLAPLPNNDLSYIRNPFLPQDTWTKVWFTSRGHRQSSAWKRYWDVRLSSDVSVEELPTELQLAKTPNDSLKPMHVVDSYQPNGAENCIDRMIQCRQTKTFFWFLLFYFWTRSGSIAGSSKSRSGQASITSHHISSVGKSNRQRAKVKACKANKLLNRLR